MKSASVYRQVQKTQALQHCCPNQDISDPQNNHTIMNIFFRGMIAAWGAKKLGGGCLSMVITFVLIYTLLCKFNSGTQVAAHRPGPV